MPSKCGIVAAEFRCCQPLSEAMQSTTPSPCPYLPQRQMVLSAGLLPAATPRQFDLLLAHGYRRSGKMIYRPACDGCRQCIPIRVPLPYRPSRSQRRTLRRVGESLKAEIFPPRLVPAHIELNNRHAAWVSADNKHCSEQDYTLAFVETCVQTRTIEYRLGGRLVGLSTVDVGQDTVSSVYFCWEPDLARLSLGTLSVLWEMDWAAKMGKHYYYLGYWVQHCSKMAYKKRFSPFELFDWQLARWTRLEKSADDRRSTPGDA